MIAPAAPLFVDSIKKRPDYLRAARGRRWVTPGFILQAIDRPDQPGAVRFGLTVSRKVGNAVVRNRVRRRLRALAAGLLPQHAAPGHDLVLIGRQAARTRPFGLMEKDLLWALKKLDLQRKL